MQIIGTLKAYLSPYTTISPDQLDGPEAMSQISFTTGEGTYFANNGYTLIGHADVVVQIMSKDEIIANKIDALRAEAVTIRAEATAKCTRIEGQINQLLCIENSAPAVKSFADEDDIPF